MLRNGLDLTAAGGAPEETGVPVWAETALSAVADNIRAVEPEAVLTRGEAAKLLYRASRYEPKSVFME